MSCFVMIQVDVMGKGFCTMTFQVNHITMVIGKQIKNPGLVSEGMWNTSQHPFD